MMYPSMRMMAKVWDITTHARPLGAHDAANVRFGCHMLISVLHGLYDGLHTVSTGLCPNAWLLRHLVCRVQELNRTAKIQSRGAAKKAETLAEARERAAFDAKVAAAVGAAMQRNQQVSSANIIENHRDRSLFSMVYMVVGMGGDIWHGETLHVLLNGSGSPLPTCALPTSCACSLGHSTALQQACAGL